jgi:NADP-dependent 3-hydroxy acid dehydrogenase YdfG
VALVAEQTGYPVELLDLDLDLEADLGIDTVKQAELFAQIRETYGIARDDSLKLRDYPTLTHVIGFVRERAAQPEVSAQAPPVEMPTPADAMVEPVPVDEDRRFPRRVPMPIVRPPLDWFAPTGVRLEQGARVAVVPDTGGVADALTEALRARGATVLTADAALDADAFATSVEAWLADGPIEGLYGLAALDNEAPLADLDIDAWRDGLRRRVKLPAAAARVLFERLAEPGSFVVTATRNGGAHGYDAAGACSAMAGAVSGFTKALARERPEALVKVIDIDEATSPADVADALVAETLGDAGIVEIGRRDTLRIAIGLEEQAAPPADPARALGPDSVVVATGAAGSIVSAILADLARAAGGGTFHLLDLIPEPDPTDPDLARLASDRDGLKQDLAKRISERGERATPALIERELAAIERKCAAVAAVSAITSTGGTAHWYRADLRDGDDVADAVRAIRTRTDRVDVLLHAGGLEISHFLPDKPPAEFDLVFDVKTDGWFHLLRNLGDTPIGTAVVFSSIAGRFGNGGQTDYSAANDLLCKSVSSFRRIRPGTRGIAIDWTAWSDIGMASRGSIPKMMAMAGIDTLPPAVGIPIVHREITAGTGGGELVVAGALGVLAEDRTRVERSPTPRSASGPMVGDVDVRAGDIAVVADLDPRAQPFLDHHRIDGTPVLPGVMVMEAFAEAAVAGVPGWAVAAIEDVAFLAPLKWYRDEPRRVEVTARLRPDGDRIVAECHLDGRRALPGQEEQITTHFTGRVVLARTVAELGTVSLPASPAGPVAAPDAIYRIYFHGPAYRVLAGAWRDGDRTIGELATDLPANHAPSSAPLLAAPRLVELCFQTAGVAELAVHGTLGLPARVRSIHIAPGATEAAARWAVVTAGADGATDAAVLDSEGRVLVRLTGYETIALPDPVGADLLDALRLVVR